MMKISLGYPGRENEDILKIGSTREDLLKLIPILSKDEILKLQDLIKNEIYVSSKVIDYIIEIVEATKRSKFLYSGISTRGSLSILLASKANAFIKGRDYVIPEDVKELIEYIIPHRVLFKEEYETINKKEIIKSILNEIPTPV
jgi:MoxR-like ATPases